MPLSVQQKMGGLFAFFAYSLWGVAPLYFKQIDEIPALDILMHRVVWSFILLAFLLTVMKMWPMVRTLCSQPRKLLVLALTSLLLAFNWGLYIWAINNDHMLETSLGYYINPLFNIVLGMCFLGERLRHVQWLAVGLAIAGVLVQLVHLGALPWIGLSLAASFAVYGLLRKKLAVDAVSGIFIESALMIPLALIYWIFWAESAAAQMGNNDWSLNVWLMAAGFVTTVPLLCFVAAAQRVQLSTLGIFQYIGPTLTFLFGVYIYHEPLDPSKMLTFGLIWAGLALYSIDSLLQFRRPQTA